MRLYGSAGGCPTGDTVTLTSKAFMGVKGHEFAGVPAVFTKVDKHGKYSVKTRIPKTTRAISLPYVISGRCGGGLFGKGTLLVD